MPESQPNWLIDLVAAVEEYEYAHADSDKQCFGPVLSNVPDEVRIAANAVADYNRAAERLARVEEVKGG